MFITFNVHLLVALTNYTKMFVPSPCRAALLQSTRSSRVSTTKRTLLAAQFYQQRHASTKHPKGFAPPSQDDLEELRERTIEFARREIPQEVAQKVDHSNEFPNDMWKKMGEAGFLGITADEDYGGLAMGYQAHCTVMEELSRASGM
jgi:isovaleryl-CoA dehydrogenase